VVEADDSKCVAMTESQVDMQGGQMTCLTRHDLSEYDYVSMGKDGFIPISMQPMTSVTRLVSDIV
jgi:hypothetical protein